MYVYNYLLSGPCVAASNSTVSNIHTWVTCKFLIASPLSISTTQIKNKTSGLNWQ